MASKDDKIKDLEAEIARLQKELAAEKAKNKKGTSSKSKGKTTHKTKDGAKKVSTKGTPRKVGQGSKKILGNVEFDIKEEADAKYHLINDIKSSPLYGKTGRDEVARKWLEANCTKVGKKSILQGQLIMFNYFEPKTKEDLEYYDAMPVTIFFNVVDTKQGKRVLGFNIHYYPPKMRYQIMNKIFDTYRGLFVKYFNTPNKSPMDAFDYRILVQELDRANLGFGVRMYIPELIGNPMIIPANKWQVAVFTEGHFKKKTRTQIMSFWSKWLKGNKKNTPEQQVKAKYKSRGGKR